MDLVLICLRLNVNPEEENENLYQKTSCTNIMEKRQQHHATIKKHHANTSCKNNMQEHHAKTSCKNTMQEHHAKSLNTLCSIQPVKEPCIFSLYSLTAPIQIQ